MIGENSVEKSLEPQDKDVEAGKMPPLKEMEKLEGEDEIRVKHLDGMFSFPWLCLPYVLANECRK